MGNKADEDERHDDRRYRRGYDDRRHYDRGHHYGHRKHKRHWRD
jgi:hypothetical protein